MKLKVSLLNIQNKPGGHSYDNKVNAENYKEIAIVLSDLANYGLPIEKAIREFLSKRKSDWDLMIGN